MTTTPGQLGVFALGFIERVVRPFARLAFRPCLDGLERLPEQGPYLLVANHSAGVGLAEIVSFASLWAERFRDTRRLAAFVHPLNYKVPTNRWIMDQLGSIPSTYETAYAVLEKGVPILVFPGGDHEALRPFWQAYRVDFGGRRGFLRIAKQAGVPIVPMGIRGSHWTAPVLLRSKPLAWLLVFPRLAGFKRWGVSLLGLFGAVGLLALPVPWPLRLGLCWAWLIFPLTFVPIIPATIRMRIGHAIPSDTLFQDDDPELHRALETVQGAIQDLVDQQR